MARLAVNVMCPSECGPPVVIRLFASSATKRAAAQKYDNTKLAVARIQGDGTRQKTRAFSELQSHYLFAEKFGRPKGNDRSSISCISGFWPWRVETRA
jgi:hypothetical protein